MNQKLKTWCYYFCKNKIHQLNPEGVTKEKKFMIGDYFRLKRGHFTNFGGYLWF